MEYSIRSSHSLERWLIVIEASNRYSATKSRSDTPSSEFSHGLSKSKSAAVMFLSMG